MQESRSYTDILVGAVRAAAEGDHARATDDLRAAMKLKFDARLARALDLVQISLLRQEKSLALHPVLAPLLPPDFDPNAPRPPALGQMPEPGDSADAGESSTEDIVISEVFSADEFDDFLDTSVNSGAGDRGREASETPFAGQERITNQRNQETRELQAIEQMGPPPAAKRHLDLEFDNLTAALQQYDFARADDILERTPTHERDADWKSVRTEVNERWEKVLRRRLDPLGRVVHPGLDDANFHSQELDARMMFLYGQVDGMTTIADLIDLSGMTAFDAMRCICRMLDAGIIRFD